MGIPATGNRIEVPLIDIARIRDGKIAEHWGVMDGGVDDAAAGGGAELSVEGSSR